MTGTRKPNGTKVLASLAVAGLLLSGCGAGESIANKATEKAVEKAVEADGDAGVDVDLDTKDGTMKFESEDGSMTMGGGDLPDGFPKNIPLPKSKYTVSFSMANNEGFQVSLQTNGDLKEFSSYLEQGLESAGYTIEDRQQANMGGMKSSTITATGHGTSLYVSASAIPEEDQMMTVTYAVETEQAE